MKSVKEELTPIEKLHIAFIARRLPHGWTVADGEAALREIELMRARIEEAESTIADLRDLAYERVPRLAAEQCEQQKAELQARVVELETRNRRLEILGAQMAGELGAESMIRLNEAAGRAVEIQARLEVETARAERYKAALTRLEWYGYRSHDLRQCLACFELQREGKHKADCWIATALAAPDREGK